MSNDVKPEDKSKAMEATKTDRVLSSHDVQSKILGNYSGPNDKALDGFPDEVKLVILLNQNIVTVGNMANIQINLTTKLIEEQKKTQEMLNGMALKNQEIAKVQTGLLNLITQPWYVKVIANIGLCLQSLRQKKE